MMRPGTMLAAMLVMLTAGATAHAKMEMRTFPVLAGAGAHDVYPAPDGAVWFTATVQEDERLAPAFADTARDMLSTGPQKNQSRPLRPRRRRTAAVARLNQTLAFNLALRNTNVAAERYSTTG